MAVASSSAMNNQDESNSSKKHDDHDDDMVMPGFRFHPTEEELVEFYLRRKVEGKRFNVELITFLDLYRFDPWELPALAAIGEKEWFFYVPRDRKYRNGDRPNRVTTSGYWKATGADRMIRSENFRSIGLKKTLVFYTGKAPKGVRTSWIMNEYRLPLHETERLQKAEISLCRVYKRAGVDDHSSLPRSLPTRASSASSSRNSQPARTRAMETMQAAGVHGGGSSDGKISDVTSPSSSTDIGTTSLPPLPNHSTPYAINPMLVPMASTLVEDDHSLKLQASHPPLTLNCNPNVDDLHRLVNFNYNNLQLHNPLSAIANHDQNLENAQNLISGFSASQPAQTQPAVALNVFPGPFPAAFSDRLWDWNAVSEANKDFTNPFK